MIQFVIYRFGMLLCKLDKDSLWSRLYLNRERIERKCLIWMSGKIY